MANPISINHMGAHLDFGKVARFLPEPTNRSGLSFSSVLEGASGLVSKVAGIALGGGGAQQFPNLDPGYADLLQKQIEVQVQMQLMTLYSNIEKSQHETKMTSLRNIRVG